MANAEPLDLHPSYRAEIDGLRAIAVIAVVGFHLFPEFIRGGFVGVDVFFVISGFLISSIIFKETENEKFSFLNFYSRRIKRLFPALIIILAMFYFYGWFVLLSDEFFLLSKHVYYGSMFLTNFLLAEEVGYFDITGVKKPFLHLWSLSIEEQYYLIWPLLLYYFTKVKRKKYLGWFILCLCIISFAISASFLLDIVFRKKIPMLTFYTPPARFWELMIGSVLAYANHFKREELNRFLRKKTICISSLSCLVGVSLIVFSIINFNSTQLYPGWLALVPVLGAFLVILGGNKTWISTKILSNRYLVFIGLISYPLYLLHWPLIAMVNIINPKAFSLMSVKIFLLMLSIFLAFLIYRWVETPIRKSSNKIALLLVSVMIIVSVQALKGYKKGFLPAIARDVQAYQVMQAVSDWEYPGKLTPLLLKGFTFYEQKSGPEKVIFLGDSNVQQYAPRIARLFEKNGNGLKSAIFATYPSWFPIPNTHSPSYPHHEGIMEAALELARNPDVTDVVIGAQWLGYFNGETKHYHEKDGVRDSIGSVTGKLSACDDLIKMIQGFIRDGKQVYLLSNIPIGWEYDPKSFFVQRDFFGRWALDKKQGNKEAWLAYFKELRPVLQKIAKDSGATLLHPEDFLCDEKECMATNKEGDPVYFDSLHLRANYVKNNVTFLDSVMLKN